MRIDKLVTVLFTMALAALVACSDGGGGGGDDDDGGTEDGGGDDGGDDGTGDDGTGDDGDDGTPDGGTAGDGSTACLGAPRQVENEDWRPHIIDENQDIEYQSNPPASGPHYLTWATWDVHPDVAMKRGHYVHNLEHGGIVLLHAPDAPEELVAALNAVYEAIPQDEVCDHKRAILAIDADLPTPVAVIAADWLMEGSCVDEAGQEAILQFVEDHRGQGPEAECDEGTIL
jgi:Protein of unknown function (DUF3105)